MLPAALGEGNPVRMGPAVTGVGASSPTARPTPGATLKRGHGETPA